MKNETMHIDKKRRSFLKLSGLVGLGVAAATLLPAEKTEALLFGPRRHKVTTTRLAMGTYVEITAIHPSRDQAQEAVGEAFAEISRLSRMLTHYQSNSPVGRFNATGKLEDVPDEVRQLVQRSMFYNQETGGAFDITVKPLIDLYRDTFAGGGKPSGQEIEKRLSLIGSEQLAFRGTGLYAAKQDIAITLDGIAKGYIVDRASTVLRNRGVANHLINAGGDIRTSGCGSKGQPWRVAIQDPEKSREYPDVLTMGDGAIATSGNYEIYYDNEKMFHHIVDSHTGRSPQLSSSVTVVAPTVMDADALATSIFVMEPEEGISFINSRPGCACFIIGRDGSCSRSGGWQKQGRVS
jgi:thiamine biosynthesis lipoprotein